MDNLKYQMKIRKNTRAYAASLLGDESEVLKKMKKRDKRKRKTRKDRDAPGQ